MASMVTMHPFNSSMSSSLGIAVISLLFSSQANCPSTRLHSAENALTTCSGGFLASFVRRVCFPSIATTPVIFSAAFCIHSTNTVCSCWVSIALITFLNVQASGIPFSSFIYFFSHCSLLFPNISTFVYDVAPHMTAVSMINSTSSSGYHTLRSRRVSSIPSSTSCKLSFFIAFLPALPLSWLQYSKFFPVWLVFVYNSFTHSNTLPFSPLSVAFCRMLCYIEK